MDDLQTLRSGMADSYPKVDPTYEAKGLMELRPGVAASASASHEQTGLKFLTPDGKYICQFRKTGMVLSRLAPYESWEPFRDEARRLWNMYRESVKPGPVTRLAVRYINRIDIPEPSVDLKRYFRTSPELSPQLPQNLARFFMQLRITQDDINAEAVINQTTIPPEQEGVVSVVFDVDLFRTDGVPQDDEAIWSYFETLHARKNEIFEACITDETRELFH
jgi:uncharacterized protein (TIGR04255 family)